MQTDFEKKLELILRDAFKCIYDNAPKEAVSIYREVSKKVDMMSEDDRILWRALGLHYWGQMQMNFARNEIIIYRDRFLQRILSGISEINMVMDIVEIDEQIHEESKTIFLFDFLMTNKEQLVYECWNEYGFCSLGRTFLSEKRYDFIKKYCNFEKDFFSYVEYITDENYVQNEILQAYEEYANIICNKHILQEIKKITNAIKI